MEYQSYLKSKNTFIKELSISDKEYEALEYAYYESLENFYYSAYKYDYNKDKFKSILIDPNFKHLISWEIVNNTRIVFFKFSLIISSKSISNLGYTCESNDKITKEYVFNLDLLLYDSKLFKTYYKSSACGGVSTKYFPRKSLNDCIAKEA